jgi:hypothetical protein
MRIKKKKAKKYRDKRGEDLLGQGLHLMQTGSHLKIWQEQETSSLGGEL